MFNYPGDLEVISRVLEGRNYSPDLKDLDVLERNHLSRDTMTNYQKPLPPPDFASRQSVAWYVQNE
jgi:hypothetical protein